MQLVDVNVLVALAVGGHPGQASARAWLEDAVRAGEPLAVPDFVAVGFVRVVTNKRMTPGSNDPADAFRFLAAFRAMPSVLTWSTRPNTDEIFQRLVADSGVRGGLVSDAYIAALAASYAATLVTFDRDFRRFRGVDVLELT